LFAAFKVKKSYYCIGLGVAWGETFGDFEKDATSDLNCRQPPKPVFVDRAIKPRTINEAIGVIIKAN